MPLDANPGIDDDAAVDLSDHGVEVELRDRVQVFAEPAESMHEVDEGTTVGCGRSTKAANEAAGLSAEHELLGVMVGQRRDAEPGLSDELGEDAAGAAGHERTEDRVLDDPREELRTSLDHRLDENGRADALDRDANGVVVSQVEGEPADVGLVCPGERGLDDDRESELARSRGGLVGAACNPLRDERKAIGKKQRARLCRLEPDVVATRGAQTRRCSRPPCDRCR